MNFKENTHSHTHNAAYSPPRPLVTSLSFSPRLGMAWAWHPVAQNATVCSLSMMAPCGRPASSFFPLLLLLLLSFLLVVPSLCLQFQFANPSLTRSFQVVSLCRRLLASLFLLFSCFIIYCFFRLSLAASLGF